jgi:hypothetical protein
MPTYQTGWVNHRGHCVKLFLANADFNGPASDGCARCCTPTLVGCSRLIGMNDIRNQTREGFDKRRHSRQGFHGVARSNA